MDAALSIGDKHKRGYQVSTVEKEITKRYCDEIAPLLLKDKNNDPNEVQDAGVPLVAIEDLTGGEAVTDVTDEASELPKSVAQTISNKLHSATGISTSSSSAAGYGYNPIDVKITIKKLLVRRLRSNILNTGKRPDGRGVEDVRPIFIETSLLPGAHGSTLFTRGETQAIATATLGSKSMEAKFETVDQLGSKRFYLQYSFPPSSVGEVGRVGGINRREVGHGNLAERALLPAIPDATIFPYSIRAESLITESCGSSSMATVCGCCLAMLDAGVPLKSSVAGVAMGLILGDKEDDEPVILTDILGLEDALGTMDFKVAGNETGITTFQLDIKSEGLTIDLIEKALSQAKRGRLHVLSRMILEFKVPPETLGKVIGPKGKTIQMLIETYGVLNINIEDEGNVQVESFSMEKNEAVKAAIMKIVEEAGPRPRGEGNGTRDRKDEKAPLGPPPEVGIIYKDCEVKGVHTFGVFVEILPGYEGLIHISELDVKKVPSPEQAGIVAGMKMDVKFLGVNEKGQMRLSRRAVLLREATTTSPLANVNSNTTNTTTSSFVASTNSSPTVSKIKPNPISSAAEDAFSAPVPATTTVQTSPVTRPKTKPADKIPPIDNSINI
eukprot:gene4249-8446_t